jgi:hypothetical protein
MCKRGAREGDLEEGNLDLPVVLAGDAVVALVAGRTTALGVSTSLVPNPAATVSAHPHLRLQNRNHDQ